MPARLVSLHLALHYSARSVRRETSYSYSKGWSTQRIDSGRFSTGGHHNPSTQIEPHTHVADATDASFAGGLRVPPGLLAQLDDWEQVSLARPGGKPLPVPSGSEGAFVAATSEGDAIHFPSSQTLASPEYRETRKLAIEGNRANGKRLRGGGGAAPSTVVSEASESRLATPSAVGDYLKDERGVELMPTLQVASPGRSPAGSRSLRAASPDRSRGGPHAHGAPRRLARSLPEQHARAATHGSLLASGGARPHRRGLARELPGGALAGRGRERARCRIS